MLKRKNCYPSIQKTRGNVIQKNDSLLAEVSHDDAFLSFLHHRERLLLAGNLKRRWTVFMNSLKSPYGYTQIWLHLSLTKVRTALKHSCWSCMRLFFLVGRMSLSCRQTIFFQSYFLTVDAALSCYFGGVNGKPGSSPLLFSSHASSRFLPLPYQRLLRALKVASVSVLSTDKRKLKPYWFPLFMVRSPRNKHFFSSFLRTLPLITVTTAVI